MTNDNASLPLFENLLPPQSLAAEQQVLGAILFDADSIAQVLDFLKPKHFYRTAHQFIFSAMLDLFQRGEPIDVTTASEWLRDFSDLDAAGGRPYLMDLAMNVATADAIRHHARIVRNRALQREALEFGDKVQVAAHQMDGAAVLEYAQNELTRLAIGVEGHKDKATSEMVAQVVAGMRDRLENNRYMRGLSSGFYKLDDLLRGFVPGLIILAARPSMGKTAFSLNLALHAAIRENVPTLFYSCEMGWESIMTRALAIESETTTDMVKIENAGATLPDWLRVLDRPTLTIPQLRASLVKEKAKFGHLGLVVIDYLQLMEGAGSNANERVSMLSRSLKGLALEFNVPIICLSQLSRAVESRQDKHPMLSDLRDSGAIEQDADVVIFLYRDEYYNKESERPGMVEVMVEKQREGATGTVFLNFRAPIQKFLNQPSYSAV